MFPAQDNPYQLPADVAMPQNVDATGDNAGGSRDPGENRHNTEGNCDNAGGNHATFSRPSTSRGTDGLHAGGESTHRTVSWETTVGSVSSARHARNWPGAIIEVTTSDSESD